VAARALTVVDAGQLETIRVLTAECARLRAALVRYGHHEEDCPAWGAPERAQPCRCGLDALLEETEGSPPDR
jgi:hypothetical protein